MLLPSLLNTFNDFNLSNPTSKLTLVGNHWALRTWDVNDRVFTNSLSGTPNPPSVSLYRSSVSNFPMGFLTNEDVISSGVRALPAVVR